MREVPVAYGRKKNLLSPTQDVAVVRRNVLPPTEKSRYEPLEHNLLHSYLTRRYTFTVSFSDVIHRTEIFTDSVYKHLARNYCEHERASKLQRFACFYTDFCELEHPAEGLETRVSSPFPLK